MLLLCLFLAAPAQSGTVGRVDLETLRTPTYTVEGDAFVRHNGDRFSNRPLYCNHSFDAVLAGDRPLVRLGKERLMLGSFMLALAHEGKSKWLHEFSDITSKYRPGRMEWTLADSSFGGTTIRLDVVPLAEGAGFALRASLDGARSGDELIWASGGAMQESQSVLARYDVTTIGREALLKRSFSPDECRENRIEIEEDGWRVYPPKGRSADAAYGRSSAPAKLIVADANEWKDPLALAQSVGQSLPITCGSVALGTNRDFYWVVAALASNTPSATSFGSNPADLFHAGLRRVENVEQQVVVETPDPWLNAAVGASCIVMDAVYRDGMFTHSGMRWSVPLLGWRSQYGASAYGWHDRVQAEAKLCINHQITNSDKLLPKADEKYGLSSQAPDSRLFGKGRIAIYQPNHYDMQSLFFDQLIHDWRCTGDPELAKLLRPALELHLQYIKDCFDPADQGIYESYANTWPTDNQWYNGGGTAEETAYAYAAQRAASDLALLTRDQPALVRHDAEMEKIRKAFIDLLWVPSRGHVGAYREQLGYKRLHESSWLYSTFCPIDAGLLAPEEAAQALYYTEWGLERVRMPYGGEQCWPSCWVPSIWSLREMWPGDNYHLALAYFHTGLDEEGWSLLRGTFPQYLLFGPVPGDLGHPAGATDFNDCASMFCRNVVEGLFGYEPNYPEGLVKIAPHLPIEWDHAAIKTPDVTLRFVRRGNISRYEVALSRQSEAELYVPVLARKVLSITVNGQAAHWHLLPGFGQSVARIPLSESESKSALVEVTTEEPLPFYPPARVECETGQTIALEAQNAHILKCLDEQGVLDQVRIADGKATGVVTTNESHHLILAMVQAGDARQWRLFKINVRNPQAEAKIAAKQVREIQGGARWNCLDISASLNADVRAIFQQKYLSPRPNTCSLRLAEDGYSTWQMMLDAKNKPPTIDLRNVPKLLDNSHRRLATQEGVPFKWAEGITNIAFTSQWDNWPRQITVPVKRAGEAICFLVCGSSNPMQVQIANAQLRMNYADGVVEKLDLVPPFNFWSLCAFGGLDYDYQRDGFCLPARPPATLQLGNNCRANVLNWRLRPGVELESVSLETLSQEVVIGLMGLTVMN